MRARAGSILHGGDELAPPILAAYYVLYRLTIDICCNMCVCQIFEIKSSIIIIIIISIIIILPEVSVDEKVSIVEQPHVRVEHDGQEDGTDDEK